MGRHLRHLVRVRSLFTLFVFVSLFAGCTGSTRVIHATRDESAIPAPSSIKDYPEALTTAGAVIRETFGLDAHPVTLYLYSDRRAFERGLMEVEGYSPTVAEATGQYARAIGSRGKILVNVDGLERTPWPDRVRLLAHELTHVAQFSLSGGVRSNSDQWLREGFADWISFQVVERLGVDRYRRLRNDLAARLAVASHREPLPSLSALASFSHWDAVRDQRGVTVTYGVAFFAVEHLLAARSPQAVIEYFRLFTISQDRRQNFRLAFGTDPDDFEVEFSRILESILR